MGQSIFNNIFNKQSKKENLISLSTDEVKSQIVINTISDGIAIIDSKGIIQLFNPAAEALTGWRATDALTLDYHTIFSLFNSAERQIQNDEDPIMQSLRSGESKSTDSLFIETVSKRKVLVSLKVIPIIRQTEEGNLLDGVVVAFRDITREKADQNAQTEFISTASHEMRTPVATIEGYLGMILNPEICTIDDRARDYATKAHDAVRHLGRLFQDLLDVTKADDHRMEFYPALIDANAAAESIVENFVERAHNKGLDLYVEQPGGSNNGQNNKVLIPPAIIYVDLDHLNEILGNLVENAIKYTKTGHIAVRVVSEDHRVRFEVSDTGIGIPKEDIQHLFQKFYRIDSSDTREVGGTGLGLYLVKKLTTNMGGTIGVESDYGHGSTFWAEFDGLTRDEAIQKAQEIKQRQQRESAKN